MGKGLDANTPLTHCAPCIRGAGYAWVGRYFKHTHSALTRAEAEAISRAGLYIVSVVEAGFPTEPGYFSLEKGKADGAFAYQFAQRLGQPHGSAIYFTVDYDAALTDLRERIIPYFQGILHAFQAASSNNPAYAIGVYGSGLTCATVTKGTPATHTWLAQSRGWRQSRTFQGWNLRQGRGATVCEVSVDTDESNGHGGGWKL